MHSLQILESSYFEHLKAARDLAMYLPIEHPRRKEIEQSTNDLIEKINHIKQGL